MPDGILGIPVVRAIMLDNLRVRCGALFITDVHPIAALCRSLRDAGQVDSALIITCADLSCSTFVESIHASAWSSERLTRKPGARA